MSRKVRIAQLSCGSEYSGVQNEIYKAAEAVNAEVFFPDIALADVERAVDRFGLDVRSADLKLMIARGMALVDGKVDADEFDAYIVAFPEFNLNRGVFRAWDADGDGAVTRDEFDAWRPARKGAKEAEGEE